MSLTPDYAASDAAPIAAGRRAGIGDRMRAAPDGSAARRIPPGGTSGAGEVRGDRVDG
ncbi:hypothetical protein [Methylobacterium platani]|uniref:hypothetical protein n=1 Tax=Methylobacterium platani TaxID=427683 RepID=UPI000A991521|nr:hypothetical protein [Methylobacterium platani]